MKLTSSSFRDNLRIPAEYAFCSPDVKSRVRLSGNRNPHLAWSELPMQAASLVLICHDYNVPSKPDDVNKEGRVIPASLPRMDFYHWVLVDIDPRWGKIEAGEFSDGVTKGGKSGPEGPRGTRQGLNDYTTWFASDPDMKGEYFGYDGPCPPWNDSIPHHYMFTLYALDCIKCPVEGTFRAPDVLAAIEKHVVGQALVTGLYTLNPDVQT